MSDGEVMAAGGMINEGDEDIEARRTLDASTSGEVEEEGHAEAKATGGGKNSGYSDQEGMAGTEADARRESKMELSELATRQADLARKMDQVFAQVSLAQVQVPERFNSARENAHHAAQMGKAGQHRQMIEFQDRVRTDLEAAHTSLDSPFGSGGSMDAFERTGSSDAAVASSPEEAPAEYRVMVAEYFSALGRME